MEGITGRQGGGLPGLTSVGLRKKQKMKKKKTQPPSALMDIHVFFQWKYFFSSNIYPQSNTLLFFLAGSSSPFHKSTKLRWVHLDLPTTAVISLQVMELPGTVTVESLPLPLVFPCPVL